MESAQYFNKRGSKLFCAFLDASKAFDKVLINGLIYKLVRRNVPLHFIRLLFYWFNNLSCSVVWMTLMSDPFVSVVVYAKVESYLHSYLLCMWMTSLLS